ncbi:hypothetical protein BDP27DRAFT_1284592 [Rhodocollybia butyracea]|uniref:Uncharacterized protein n=1 Tax=Rhodocollybia butyracea TaxID=206335 RepID=A0A9P5QAA1_9AGAR|nr:hypothetical protein BDP27DRAFT_1284592 [Rhodocollybia butyracea]
MSSNLQTLLKALDIPAEHAQSESAETISRLDAWKGNTLRVLHDLSELLKNQEYSVSEQADIIAASASFDGEDSWITPESQDLATEILANFSEPSFELMVQLLETNINNLFRSSPHPSLNISTGRKLDRPAGGSMGGIDFYEAQAWKKYPQAFNIMFWCLCHIQAYEYDRLWYLVIPPVMTFLDDYQVSYKLKGVRLVTELLEHAPREILKRTGVDGLLLTSLNTCLAQLDDLESPKLIKATVSASLSVTLLTTTPGSVVQFNQLCALLGERIIGTIWLYSYDKPGVVQASVDALSPLLKALGLGCSRYLKALIPQLVHPLVPVPFKPMSEELQICSLKALTVVIYECSCRMSQWKGTIIDGISRCWVHLADSPFVDPSRMELQRQLRSACEALASACPTVVEDEFRRLVAVDHNLFQSLVGGSGKTLPGIV